MSRVDMGKVAHIFPMPVTIIAAYDENDKVELMNAAWAQNATPGTIALFISVGHKTTETIRKTGAFTVSLADAAHVVEADYVGIASGNNEPEKFAKTGLTAVKSENVNAPVIPEFPITYECELADVLTGDGVNNCIVGRVVNLSVDEKVLGSDGNVDPEKTDIIMFDEFTHGYYKLGERVGTAWDAGNAIK